MRFKHFTCLPQEGTRQDPLMFVFIDNHKTLEQTNSYAVNFRRDLKQHDM